MTVWKRNLIVCWIGTFTTSAGVNFVIPFMPFYIQQLGVKNLSAVEQLSGISFSITFLAAALMSPFWGKLADTKGRKLVMMCTSLGLAVVNLSFLFAKNVEMLIFFRMIQGLVSGYNPAANSLIAKETPSDKAGWALATLSTGMMAGTLLGPVIGGYLDELVGIRYVYIFTTLFLFFSFSIATLFLVDNKSDKTLLIVTQQKPGPIWERIDAKFFVFSLMLSACLMNTANQSIEPIVSLYVKNLLIMANTATSHVSLYSGIVISATGLGILLSASFIGRLADRTNYMIVIRVSLIASAIVFLPMAFVKNAWELMALRFLLGITQAGILPIIYTLLRNSTPSEISGRVFGYNQAGIYIGLVLGPLFGSEISSHFGFSDIFLTTASILVINFIVISFAGKRVQIHDKS
jgi:MFS family permease